VWLDAPIEVLHSRLQGDQTRPLLQDRDPLGKLQALLEKRRPLYANADVHIHVEPKSTPEQLTILVLAELKKVVKSSVLN
ncbi:MAG: shikimate kinase, partial [Okeania sp. SIO2D1]|nr:shikimate kinase [Okeania sp. SIO2D1]